MITGSLARRYSRALLAIGQETGKVEELGKEMTSFFEVFSRQKDLNEALTGPVLKRDDKDKIITQICERLGLGEVITNFMRLLNEKGRMEYLDRIVAAYQEMADEASKRVRADVTSPESLTDKQSSKVKDALAKMSGKEVIMEVQKDPGLIGGMVVRIGGLLLDGSLKTQLQRIKDEMYKEM